MKAHEGGTRRLMAAMAATGTALTGCGPAPYDTTARFYQPLSAQAAPPKPEAYAPPILHAVPFQRPYRVLGAMTFTTVEDEAWWREALRWNARRVGADAVLLRGVAAREQLYSYTVPGFPSNDRTFTDLTQTVTGPDGRPQTIRTRIDQRVPFYNEDRTVVGTRTLTTIDAEFVQLMDKELFGWIGLTPAEIVNTRRLMIDAVDAGGPAERAGLRAGDILVSVGEYACEQGLADFYRNLPAPRRGERVRVRVQRGGETIEADIIPVGGAY